VQLPNGYMRRTTGHACIDAAAPVVDYVTAAVDSAGSLHAWAAAQPQTQRLGGRGAALLLRTDDGAWVIRHYQRGGAIARVLHDRYMHSRTSRAVAELRVSAAARSRGIATPRVTAAVTYPAGIFYRADLATEYIAAEDLADAAFKPGASSADQRRAAWRATGALLRRCFDEGLQHPDLNLRNILIERTDAGTTAHVIDLDRASIGAAVNARQRDRMLARFHRSRRKFEHATLHPVPADELRALDEGLHA
jgi:3-deoxy-D-manno-octulosonic acid kinase